MRTVSLLAILLLPFAATAQPPKATPGNRLAYLDELDPYYPHAKFPKLTTPQWVGEPDVDAVVILAIDDMRDPKKYETFLRPILNRLKKIDGRAPVSIMTCNVDPQDPQLQSWLKEGLSLECHTVDHPCPFFKYGFDKAKETYDRCVDLMNAIPGIYLFVDMQTGWKKLRAGKAGDANAIPMIARNGKNNGCFAHSGHRWWANEDTVLLKNHVDKRSYKELLEMK